MRFAVPFVISAVLLLLLAHSVADQKDELVGALGNADWRLVVPAIGLYFIGAYIRGARWGLLLPAYNIPTLTLFRALVVGFTVNNLLPLRMGEIARAYLLARWRGVAYGATIASLVMERVLDGLSLAILLLLALLFVPSAPGYLVVAGVIAGAGFLAGTVVLGLASWRASSVTWLARTLTRPLPPRIQHLALRLAESFAHSLALVRGARRLLALLALSLLAWCAELGVFYVLLFGFPIRGSYPLALLVGASANFATLLPSSPGYVGTFDNALVKVLSDSAGISPGLALAYAVVVHATLFLPVVVLGTLVLWRSHVSFDQVTHAPDSAPTPAGGGGDWQAAA
jgi:uncharacterized protein (TIRG00374 family)